MGAVGGRQPARRRRKRRLRQDTLQRSACQRHAGADGSQQGSGERGSSGRPRSRGGGRGRQEHPPPPWGARGAGGRGAYKIARGWTKAVFCVVREANATHGSKSATAEHWRGNETPNGAKQQSGFCSAVRATAYRNGYKLAVVMGAVGAALGGFRRPRRDGRALLPRYIFRFSCVIRCNTRNTAYYTRNT